MGKCERWSLWSGFWEKGNQSLDEHWTEQWREVDGGEKISTQRDDPLLLRMGEQLSQNQEQRMDDNKDNELIVLMSNWSVGFSEAYEYNWELWLLLEGDGTDGDVEKGLGDQDIH